MPTWERYDDYGYYDYSINMTWSEHLFMCIKNAYWQNVIDILQSNKAIEEIDLDHKSESHNSTLAHVVMHSKTGYAFKIIYLLTIHGADLTIDLPRYGSVVTMARHWHCHEKLAAYLEAIVHGRQAQYDGLSLSRTIPNPLEKEHGELLNKIKSNCVELLQKTKLAIDANINIINNCHAIYGLYNAWNALFNANILTQKNIDVINRLYWQNPNDIARLLVVLNQADLRTEENCGGIQRRSSSTYSAQLLTGLKLMIASQLLNDESLPLIVDADKPKSLAVSLCKKKQTPWMTDAMIELVSNSAHPETTCKALDILYDANLIMPECLNAIRNGFQADDRAKCLVKLHQQNALTAETIEAVAVHQRPKKIIKAFSRLDEKQLSLPENMAAVVCHYKAKYAACLLIILEKHKLLTDQNRQAVKNYDSVNDPYKIEDLCSEASRLTYAGKFNQKNFDALIVAQVIKYGMFAATEETNHKKATITKSCSISNSV